LILQIRLLELLPCLAQGLIEGNGKSCPFGSGKCRSSDGHFHFVLRNLSPGAENQQPLHQILQLPDIAVPLMVAQVILGTHIKSAIGQLFVLHEMVQIVVQQVRYVLAMVPQGRYMKRHHIEIIEQILPEIPCLDLVFQFALGRGDDTDIDLHGLDAADAQKGAGIQGAQKLCLGLDAHGRHLVEKQGAPPRLLQGAVMNMAVFLAAEQLTC